MNDRKGGKQVSKRVPAVLLAGQYQNGKSTLINCLLEGRYALEGTGLATTATRTEYEFATSRTGVYELTREGAKKRVADGLSQTIERKSSDKRYVVTANADILKEMRLIDAPGWGAGDADDKQSELSLDDADFVVYIAQPRQLSDADRSFLKLLRDRRTYFSVILNARDTTSPEDPSLEKVGDAIVGAIKQCGAEDQFIRFPSVNGVCVVNLLWAKFARHLLDSPEAQREKVQRQTVLFERTYQDVPDHQDMAFRSGIDGWRTFLRCAMSVIPDMPPPRPCDLRAQIVDSICKNLISLIEGV